MFRPQVLCKNVPLGLKQLHRLLGLQVIGFRPDIGPRHSLLLGAFCSAGSVRLVLGAIEILIEIKQIQEVVLRLERRVFPIQLYEVSRRAISLFLNEADVVLFLEFEHLVFGIAQVLFHLNELLGDAGGNFVAAVLAHTFFEVEILLHKRVQIGLGVVSRAADGGELEDRCARALQHSDFDRHRLHLRMSGPNKRFGTALHFHALHELNLGAVEIDVVFTINRALRNVELARENHLPIGKERGRRLVNEPGLNEKTETDR